jgi:two-component system OmpR family response regulator
LRHFQWFAAGPVPVGCDLRRLGWKLLRENEAVPEGEVLPLIAMPARLVLREWVTLFGATPARRRRVLVVGVEDALERARLLRLGFGDAIGAQPHLEEVECRALRIEERIHSLPRHRHVGPLRLDLLAREAFVAGRAVGLHPREFALLWRLADHPGETVGSGSLLTDIWRLAFRPETNSLAVHVSRLRSKLRVAGLDGLIETTAEGGYRLATSAVPLPGGEAAQFALDGYLRLGEEQVR